MEILTQLGRYQLLERIAQGGMADVYLARMVGAEGFEKRLVVKQIRPGLARNPRLVGLFINEARIAVCLNHPNIVQVYELNRVGDDWFISMEYIHGQDLTRIIRTLRAQDRLLPAPLAVHAVASALRGLAHAHGRTDAEGAPLGIVHGDISPHNLVVSFAGEVKVVDFGIARLSGKGFGEERGKPGGGKFAYMSPEQARGEPLDHRSDIFSAGIVLYEALVGRRLYDHDDPDRKLSMVLEAKVPDPRLQNSEITDDLWAVMERALARDKDQRFQKAEEFEEELRAWLYRHGHRGDNTTMTNFMGELFGPQRDKDPALGDLERLADDLARLERSSSMHSLTPASCTPTTSRGAGKPGGHWAGADTEELKTVAALVVEVAGQTDQWTTMDAALLQRRRSRWSRWFRETAARYGALLLTADEDGGTLLFGAPRTRSDDLQRALSCALALKAAAVAPLPEPSSSLCIGVHQGEAAFMGGAVGAPVVAARGDTLKLARRLAAVADMGEVRVSDRVAELSSDFAFQQAAPMHKRGGAVSGTWTLQERRARAMESEGPWLVRGDEVEVLRGALAALSTGAGHVVMVQGEEGAGKSRLVQEVATLARNHNLSVHTARAMPQGTSQPMAFLRDLVAQVTGINQGDSPSIIRGKLERLAALRLDQANMAVMARLFAAGRGGPAAAIQKEILAEAVRRFVLGLAAERPVLLVVEDVENLDPPELDLLLHLARTTREQPVLLIVSGAFDLCPGLAGLYQMPSSTVHLLPLDRVLLGRLVSAVYDGARPAPALLSLLHGETGGNPLHALEVLRSLKRVGHLTEDGREVNISGDLDKLPTPGGIRGLLSARLDALDPATRAAAQAAAVLGMRFPLPLLLAVLDDPEADDVVKLLLARGIVARQGSTRDGPLEFASRSFWEVAAESLIGTRRQEIHRRVAEVMESFYEGQLDPHLETLARHYANAGQPSRAVATITAAGNLHRRDGFLGRALRCFELALEWTLSAEDGADIQEHVVVDLHLRAGQVAQLQGLTRQAERYLQLALDEAEDQGLSNLEALACLSLGRLYMTHGRQAEAEACLDQARTMARPGSTIGLEALEALGNLALERGLTEEAETRFAELLRAASDQPSLRARAMLGQANHCLRRDHLDRAMNLLGQAEEAAQEARDRILLGRIVNNIGLVHHSRGHWTLALESFRRAMELRKDTGYRVGVIANLHNIGDTYFRMGDLPRAWAAFQKSGDMAKEMGWRPGMAMNEIFLAHLASLQGEEAGPRRLEAAIAMARSLNDSETVATGLWLRSRLEATQDRWESARASMEAARAVAHEGAAENLARRLDSAHLPEPRS